MLLLVFSLALSYQALCTTAPIGRNISHSSSFENLVTMVYASPVCFTDQLQHLQCSTVQYSSLHQRYHCGTHQVSSPLQLFYYELNSRLVTNFCNCSTPLHFISPHLASPTTSSHPSEHKSPDSFSAQLLRITFTLHTSNLRCTLPRNEEL